MARPTKAQAAVLAAMSEGCVLVRSFDVWVGYWWWLRPTNSKVSRATAEALVRNKWVHPGENVRVRSGYHEQVHTLPAEPKA